MKEYELEVLEQYDIEVKNIKRGRNSFLFDTDRGLCIVQNTGMSETVSYTHLTLPTIRLV